MHVNNACGHTFAGAVTGKQDSPRREAFHCMMEPYVHYVPVARDLGDLEAQLRWALSNASRLRQIATNGGALALRLPQHN